MNHVSSHPPAAAGTRPGLIVRVWPVAIVAVAIMLVPSLTLAVSALTMLLQLSLSCVCNLSPARRPDAAARIPDAGVEASVTRLCVHIAARNEPPGVLIATLESLREQVGAPDHEVIVIINNTPARNLWQPIEDWCRAAGPRFRFVRRDNVTGAKAGALNIALAQTDASASHIVVLDADYRVVPGFLAMVGRELRATGADFIQFPQAYRHMSPRTEGLSFELAEYFDRHARAANLAHAMLLTGTLSVIRRDALAAVGGWPSQSCTEDAELGTALIAAGYRGVFVDRIVGRGLMPLDLRNLHRQRARWAAGNARVLVEALRRWRRGGRDAGAGPFQRLLVVAQLATWLNLGAIAVVTLILGVGQAAIGGWTGQGGRAGRCDDPSVGRDDGADPSGDGLSDVERDAAPGAGGCPLAGPRLAVVDAPYRGLRDDRRGAAQAPEVPHHRENPSRRRDGADRRAAVSHRVAWRGAHLRRGPVGRPGGRARRGALAAAAARRIGNPRAAVALCGGRFGRGGMRW